MLIRVGLFKTSDQGIVFFNSLLRDGILFILTDQVQSGYSFKVRGHVSANRNQMAGCFCKLLEEFVSKDNITSKSSETREDLF